MVEKVVGLLKVTLSSILAALPFLFFHYFFEDELNSWLFNILSIIFIAFILEHFYRKLCAMVLEDDAEKSWGGWLKVRFFGRALLLVGFSVFLKWMAGLILTNLPLDSQNFLFATVYLVILLIVYCIIYFSYTAFLAYGMEDVEFFEGIAKGFFIIDKHTAFFIISAIVTFIVSNIPSFGYILSVPLFIFTEYLKANIYIDCYDLQDESYDEEYYTW